MYVHTLSCCLYIYFVALMITLIAFVHNRNKENKPDHDSYKIHTYVFNTAHTISYVFNMDYLYNVVV